MLPVLIGKCVRGDVRLFRSIVVMVMAMVMVLGCHSHSSQVDQKKSNKSIHEFRKSQKGTDIFLYISQTKIKLHLHDLVGDIYNVSGDIFLLEPRATTRRVPEKRCASNAIVVTFPTHKL